MSRDSTVSFQGVIAESRRHKIRRGVPVEWSQQQHAEPLHSAAAFLCPRVDNVKQQSTCCNSAKSAFFKVLLDLQAVNLRCI